MRSSWYYYVIYMPTCISHFHGYTILLFPPKKKNDEKVIYLAKQLTMLLSLKSCETVQFTIYAERGKNACEVYKKNPLKTRLVWVAMYPKWVAAFNYNQSIFSIILAVNFNFSISQLPLMLTLTMIYGDVINRQTDRRTDRQTKQIIFPIFSIAGRSKV